MVKMGKAHRIGMTILISVILTTLIVSLVNVGLSIFLESPEYGDFCGNGNSYASEIKGVEVDMVCTADAMECPDGSFVSRNPNNYCEFDSCSPEYESCSDEWDAAREDYNQYRYYVFALVGFILLLTGLYHKELMIQVTGLASGGILLLEGIVTNFKSKTLVFVTLLIIFVVFGIGAWKTIKKLDK